MMNAADIGRMIDAYMAQHYQSGDVLDVGVISKAVLDSLAPDDRNAIDRELLRQRIMARGCGYAGMRW